MTENTGLERHAEAILRAVLKFTPHEFGKTTCPASRHAMMISKGMRSKRGELHKLLDGRDPEHMGESIASAVESLWHARQWMRWEPGPPTMKYPMGTGQWVPNFDPEAILAACQALRDEGRREGIEAAAKHIEPGNRPSDWTEYATIRHEAAQSIRAIDPANLGEG